MVLRAPEESIRRQESEQDPDCCRRDLHFGPPFEEWRRGEDNRRNHRPSRRKEQPGDQKENQDCDYAEHRSYGESRFLVNRSDLKELGKEEIQRWKCRTRSS